MNPSRNRKRNNTKKGGGDAPQRKSRRTSGDAPKAVESDVTPQLFLLRKAFAGYLLHAAEAIDEPNVLTIQGRHKRSLSLELQLSPRQYSAILIGCGLVKLHGGKILVDRAGWHDFFQKYLLRDFVSMEGVCEMTEGEIKYNALGLAKIEECRDNMLKEKKQFEDVIAKLKEEIKDAPIQIAKLRKARKVAASSLYSKCENVFKEYGVERGSYHGGNFNGVNIIKLMLNAKKIMDQITKLFEDEGRDESKDTAETLCKDVKELLQAWDYIFACIHEKDPTDKFCDDLQLAIDAVMEKWRKLELSVTPKGHGVETEVTKQMKEFPGGIATLLEYWVEHAHQIGGKKDTLWKSQSLKKQGTLGAKRDVALRLAETLNASNKVQAAFRKVRKRGQTAASLDADNVKREGRKEAVASLRLQLEESFTLADLAAVTDDNN